MITTGASLAAIARVSVWLTSEECSRSVARRKGSQLGGLDPRRLGLSSRLRHLHPRPKLGRRAFRRRSSLLHRSPRRIRGNHRGRLSTRSLLNRIRLNPLLSLNLDPSSSLRLLRNVLLTFLHLCPSGCMCRRRPLKVELLSLLLILVRRLILGKIRIRDPKTHGRG